MQAKLAIYLQLIRWNRPAGWLLLLWPTLSALWLASHGFPGWHFLTVFVLGTFLMRSAGCCLNDVADRDFDRHVKRTAQRPVTSGKLGSREALAVGAVLALMAFGLVLTTNSTAIAWSFAALTIAILYPFSKRYVAMPQAVLGVAFSFGIPMAFAAVQSRPGCRVIATDTCVPISRLADCLLDSITEADASGIPYFLVGHVGDGNFHFGYLIDPTLPAERELAERLNHQLVERALKLGGTCTGEHGEVRRHRVVGRIKGAREIAGGDRLRVRAHQMAKDAKPCRLGQRGQCLDGSRFVHMSRYADIL